MGPKDEKPKDEKPKDEKPKEEKPKEKPKEKQKGEARRNKEKEAIKAKKQERKKLLESIKFHDDREHLNIVFIGHVDAGKSTISGQLMLLTGQVDERTIAKYEKEAKEKNRESWYLA